MSDNNRSIGGIVVAAMVLAGVVAGAFAFEYLRRADVPATGAPAAVADKPVAALTVTALVGGEKMGLLKNPRVEALLREKYGLVVDATKSGSLEMVQSPAPGKDALWPSTQTAAEIYEANGGVAVGKENIFASPVVFYAWDSVADALTTQGIASTEAGVRYVDVAKLTDAITAGKAWKDVGLPSLFGKVKVHTTDPAKSSSGSMFLALLASALNGGEVVTEGALPTVEPKVHDYYAKMGSMEASSADLFANFLNQGVGARPIIVGYENQLVEFSVEHPEFKEVLHARIRTMYPRPTTWSEHPVIAVTPNGKKLIEALKDPEIQKIAWEQHGFRSGLIGATNDPAALGFEGIARQVDAVVPAPSAKVMQELIGGLGR